MTAPKDRTLLLLGASGDLAKRYLLPGLGALVATGEVAGISLIGAGTQTWDDERWRTTVARAFASTGARGGDVDAVIRGARYLPADVTADADLRRLLDAVRGELILYFALPPAVTRRCCEVLATIGLPPGTRMVMEKPFGTDAASARALNQLLASMVPEERIFRVDHFLAMHTVLDLFGLRFANRIVEPLLTNEHVARVDIFSDESLGLEDRAVYYDKAGALVDVTQNHLLQVLALFAMDAPAELEGCEVRERKATLLRATHVWDDDPVTWSRRGRYTAGTIDGRSLPSYVDERGVDPARNTETFAEIVLAVDTPRWKGVPFYLRNGKALRALNRSLVVTFRDPPRMPGGLTGERRPNRLVVGLEPSGLALDLTINGPGDARSLDPVTLRAEVAPSTIPEYGEVLRSVLAGDPTLFVGGDMAVESWRIVEPVLTAWKANQVPLQDYEAGGEGPASRCS